MPALWNRHGDRIVLVAFFLGAAVVLATMGYHIVWHPEWTEAQASREMWALRVFGAALTLPLIMNMLWGSRD